MYFRTIVQTGSFTEAAIQLHMAQPPLSRQIGNLEAELGVQLLNRGAKGVTPTDAGNLLLSYADQLIQLRDQADHQVRFLGTAVSGKLQLGMISSAVGVLPNSLAELTQHYPDVQLLVREGHTYQLIDWLEKHQIDAAIVRTPFSVTGCNKAGKIVFTDQITFSLPNQVHINWKLPVTRVISFEGVTKLAKIHPIHVAFT